MKKIITLVYATLVLVSCKTQQVVAEAKAKESKPAAEIAAGHYANKKNFTTAYIKADVAYKDRSTSQRLSAEIRIAKDEKILISLRLLGITVAKALITPTQVNYYEMPNRTYFEGDYASLSKWLGTDLDFMKVQRMLLGEALDDLTAGRFVSSLEDQMYKLGQSSANAEKVFYFEASKFLLKRQGVAQPALQRILQVSYPGHRDYPEATLPSGLSIEATEKAKTTTIDIDYNSATFNENLTFPYKVPEGYDRQELD